jgi:hypothetical protein
MIFQLGAEGLLKAANPFWGNILKDIEVFRNNMDVSSTCFVPLLKARMLPVEKVIDASSVACI